MKRIRRGMTLLELLLAVSVTSTVALGIVGMMDALTNVIIDQRDTPEPRSCGQACPRRVFRRTSPGHDACWILRIIAS